MKAERMISPQTIMPISAMHGKSLRHLAVSWRGQVDVGASPEQRDKGKHTYRPQKQFACCRWRSLSVLGDSACMLSVSVNVPRTDCEEKGMRHSSACLL